MVLPLCLLYIDSLALEWQHPDMEMVWGGIRKSPGDSPHNGPVLWTIYDIFVVMLNKQLNTRSKWNLIWDALALRCPGIKWAIKLSAATTVLN